jgi:hypothetical protein
VVALAAEITALMGLLVLHGHQTRRWEPKTLPFHLFMIPATLANSWRRVRLHLAARSPFARLALDGLGKLANLAPGMTPGTTFPPTRSTAAGEQNRRPPRTTAGRPVRLKHQDQHRT